MLMIKVIGAAVIVVALGRDIYTEIGQRCRRRLPSKARIVRVAQRRP